MFVRAIKNNKSNDNMLMRKGLLKIASALFTMLISTSVYAQTGGNCGDGGDGQPATDAVTWEMNGSQLIFSGTGAIKTYSTTQPTEYPWFSNMNDIQSVIIGEGITNIPAWAFAMYGNLRSIHLPSTLKILGWSCLEETNLWNVSLPEGLEKIEGYAFMMTPFSTVSIPSTVTEIGERAFGYCDDLVSVGCYADAPPTLGSNAFGDSPIETVYVQSAKIATYKAADGWSDFGDKIQSPAGNCGPDGNDEDGDDDVTKATWTFDMSTRTLTIEGTKMGQYNRPWESAGMGGSGGGFNPDNNVGYPHGINHIIIEEGISVIPAMAFYMEVGVTDVIMPSTLTSIGMQTFGENFNLETVTCNAATPPTFGEDMFSECSKLATIIVPAASVAAYKAAAGWSDYADKIVAQGGAPATTTTFTYTASEKVTKFDTYSNFTGATDVKSHEFADGAGTVIYNGTVTGLGLRALNSTKLTGITIPESVTSIGDRAFSDCSTLAAITFAGTSAVTSIGEYAFAGCKVLTSFSMPAGVATIGGGAFQGCSELASITIPESLTIISDYTFNNCKKLATVTFSGTPEVSIIGLRAFYSCEALTSIAIPASVDSIKGNAFESCKMLASVTFPETSVLTTLGTGVFQDCGALKSITLPESLKTIGEIQKVSEETYYNNSLFWGAGLTSFVLPKNVVNIYGGGMFANCPMTSLTVAAENDKFYSKEGANAIFEKNTDKLLIGCVSTVVPDGTKVIGREAFFAEQDSFSITLPESVTVIEERAFHLASGLTGINIPAGVSEITAETFMGCSFQNLIIPDAVKTIGEMAFAMCIKLKTVSLGAGVDSIADMAFVFCPEMTDVYCSANPSNLIWDGRDRKSVV